MQQLKTKRSAAVISTNFNCFGIIGAALCLFYDPNAYRTLASFMDPGSLIFASGSYPLDMDISNDLNTFTCYSIFKNAGCHYRAAVAIFRNHQLFIKPKQNYLPLGVYSLLFSCIIVLFSVLLFMLILIIINGYKTFKKIFCLVLILSITMTIVLAWLEGLLIFYSPFFI